MSCDEFCYNYVEGLLKFSRYDVNSFCMFYSFVVPVLLPSGVLLLLLLFGVSLPSLIKESLAVTSLLLLLRNSFVV